MEQLILEFLQKDLILTLPALGVAILLGYIGTMTVPMVRKLKQNKYTEFFLNTAFIHPVIGGALFGLSEGLPVPTFMPDSWAGSILWYSLAGVASLPLYQRFMKKLKVKG